MGGGVTGRRRGRSIGERGHPADAGWDRFAESRAVEMVERIERLPRQAPSRTHASFGPPFVPRGRPAALRQCDGQGVLERPFWGRARRYLDCHADRAAVAMV